MNSIKAVLIDFGGVLYKNPDPKTLTRMLRLVGITDLGPLLQLNASPRESQWVADIWTGKIPETQIWEDVRRQWRMHPRVLAFLRRAGHNPRRLNRVLANFVSALRPFYHTAILTNAGTDFRSTFGAAFRLEQYVDHLIVSAEEGLAKPDPDLFHLAAGRLGITPEQAVFIDDRQENVEGAQQAGMQAFLFQDTQQAITALQSLLNAAPPRVP